MYHMHLVTQALLSEKRASIEDHKIGSERFELNPAFTLENRAPRRECKFVLELKYTLDEDFQPVYCSNAKDCVYAS